MKLFFHLCIVIVCSLSVSVYVCVYVDTCAVTQVRRSEGTLLSSVLSSPMLVVKIKIRSSCLCNQHYLAILLALILFLKAILAFCVCVCGIFIL